MRTYTHCGVVVMAKINSASSKQTGLSPSLFNELRDVLQRCFSFDSSEKIKYLVGNTQPISMWVDEIPQETNASGRLDAVINLFKDKRTTSDQNGLVLFLETIRERVDQNDKCHQELGSLIKRTSKELGSSNNLKATEDQLRAAIYHGEWDLVSNLLGELEHKGESYQIYLRGRRLLRVAMLTHPGTIFEDIEACAREWPDETICAYLAARTKIRILFYSLNNAHYILPAHKVSQDNEHLLASLARIDLPIQKRNWPPYGSERPKRLPPDLPPIRQFAKIVSQPATQIFIDQSGKRRRRPFWGKHPLVQRLTTTSESLFIYSPRGGGQTTFARAIKHYVDDRTLVFYDSNLELDKVKQNLTEQLFQFLLDHPTWLSTLDADGLRLLASIIRKVLSINIARDLEQKIDSLGKNPRNQSSGGSNLSQPLWTMMSQTYLTMLKNEWSESQAKDVRLTDIARCADSLGFRKILLIVDCNNRNTLRTVTHIIRSILDDTKYDPVHVLLFYHSLAEPVAEMFHEPPIPIEWTNSDLQDMIDSWFDVISARDKIINYFSSEELWKRFLSAYQNPKELVKDLRKVITSFPGDLEYAAISVDYLKRILGDKFP